MAHKLESLYKVFVGNLPWTIGHPELYNYIKQFGPVVDAQVSFDKTGISRGFGYVVFANQTGYSQALDKKDHFLEGRMLDVAPSKK